MSHPATITVEQAAGVDWDVIVIGAGPAGAVAARELARRGVSVLLVERRGWPRRKVCGGCLLGRGLDVLRSLELEQALVAGCAAPITRLVLHHGSRRAELSLPAGVAIERSAFDEALVNAAREARAAFLSGVQAIVEPQSTTGGDRSVRLEGSTTAAVTRTRIVVAADGLGHPGLKQLAEFDSAVESESRIGLGLAVEQLPPSFEAGAIYMAVASAGYAGLVQTGDGRWNLAAAIDPAALRAAATPAEAVGRLLDDAGLRGCQLSAVDSWRGTIPLTRKAARLAARRIFLIGDAAGYVEPFTGEGIGWALSAAVDVVPWIVRGLDQWNDHLAHGWEAEQRHKMLHGQATVRLLAGLLRRPLATGLAMRALNVMPSLARPWVRRISGAPKSAGRLSACASKEIN